MSEAQLYDFSLDCRCRDPTQPKESLREEHVHEQRINITLESVKGIREQLRVTMTKRTMGFLQANVVRSCVPPSLAPRNVRPFCG